MNTSEHLRTGTAINGDQQSSAAMKENMRMGTAANSLWVIPSKQRLPSWETLNLEGQHVVIRVDFNLPPGDDSRLKLHIPTIREVLKKNPKAVTLLSHFGRPKGKADPEFSLAPVAVKLAAALDYPVEFIPSINEARKLTTTNPTHPPLRLLENLRFHAGEENNDAQFAQSLAQIGDVVLLDAFSAAHRAHASTFGIAAWRPTAIGPAMQIEWEFIEQAVTTGKSPRMALIGGAKIDSKLPVITALLQKVDTVFLGGRLAFPLLATAPHLQAHAALLTQRLGVDATSLAIGHDVWKKARERKVEVIVPVDLVWADSIPAPMGSDVRTVAVEDVQQLPDHFKVAPDIGPQTVKKLQELVTQSATVMWNGPLGAFEFPPFHQGTKAVAQLLSQAVIRGSVMAVAGGGDTISALQQSGVRGTLSYESLSGGAFLEFIEKDGALPGLFLPQRTNAI